MKTSYCIIVLKGLRGADNISTYGVIAIKLPVETEFEAAAEGEGHEHVKKGSSLTLQHFLTATNLANALA